MGYLGKSAPAAAPVVAAPAPSSTDELLDEPYKVVRKLTDLAFMMADDMWKRISFGVTDSFLMKKEFEKVGGQAFAFYIYKH